MTQIKNYITAQQARALLSQTINRAFQHNLKMLLETKHLYQSVDFDFESLVSKTGENLLTATESAVFQQFVDGLYHLKLTPSESDTFPRVGGMALDYPAPTLVVQNIKIYCSRCKQKETFSPTFYFDATDAVAARIKEHPRTAAHPPQFQLFVLVFQCETCKKIPLAFLVKRNQWKMWLEGRSPIEQVDVPEFLPKKERWLFSDAVIAAQTGNMLAGIFYLRSFIEQFARRQTGIQDRQPGENIVAAYQALIPEKQRDQMPSLRSLYETLSVPIHAAEPDGELFEQVKDEVLRHFDFRRLFKIAELNVEVPSQQKNAP